MAAGGERGPGTPYPRQAGAGNPPARQGAGLRQPLTGADPPLHAASRDPGRRASQLYPGRRSRRFAPAPGPQLFASGARPATGASGCGDERELDDGRYLRPPVGPEGRRTRDDPDVLNATAAGIKSWLLADSY